MKTITEKQELRAKAIKVLNRLQRKVNSSGYVENLGAKEEREFKDLTFTAMTKGLISYQDMAELNDFFSIELNNI